MWRYIGALRQVRCVLVAVCAGLAGATAQPAGAPPPAIAVSGTQVRLELTARLQMADQLPMGWQPGHPGGATPEPRWQPVTEQAVIGNHGTRDLDLWFRLDLLPDASAPRDWFWVVANPHLDLVELWTRTDGHPPRLQRTGDFLPAAQRPWVHRFPILPLVLEPGRPTAVFMHVRTSGTAQVPVSLWQPAALWQNDQLVHSVLGLYFGLLVGLFAYNLLLCLTLRERVYLHYIALVASIGIFQLGHTGLGTQYFWPDGGAWSALVQAVCLALAGLFSLLFARAFLAPQAWAPRLDRAIRVLLCLWLVALFVVPWVGVPMTAAILIPLGLLTILALLGGAVGALRAKRPGASSFALAWAALLLGALVLVLVRAGGLPPHPVLVHAFMAGSAIEMVLLSFALADRIKAERAARDQALAMTVREQVLKDTAQRASLDKSRFMLALSHDLRQPLYALTLATESMARQRPLRHPGPMLAQMKSALESADVLLDSLHTVARLETGSIKPQVTEFSVQALLERLDHMYGPLARSHGLRWTVTPSIARARSDPVLLERMLSNLIANALRFTERGGVVVACRPRQDHLLVQVWDTGQGMSSSDQQAWSGGLIRGLSDSDSGVGVGLGLAIVRQCAALLAIDLSIRSTPGRGSCFCLRVPRAAPPSGEA
jgi:signal transduction histidine kinase